MTQNADGTTTALKPGDMTSLASFDVTHGSYPQTGLVEDAAGNLYGTTVAGGANNQGTVFEIVAGSNTVTTLASLGGLGGQYPNGNLAIDADGNLFGTASSGGGADGYSQGTVFEITSASIKAGTSTLTTLVTFDGVNGGNPGDGVTIDASGNLFGTTQYGGGTNGSGEGTVFEITKASIQGGTSSVTTLATFVGDTGQPYGKLAIDGSGNLYGDAYGADGNGMVFEVKQSDFENGVDNITTLANFDSTNGGASSGSLIVDASGNLFGSTAGSEDNFGTVFEIKAGSGSITTVATFDGSAGENPYGGLVEDGDGNLYGTTAESGDALGVGTVFEITAASIKNGGGAVQTLGTFDYTNNGAYPTGGLIRDAAGDLFGTTTTGGANGKGYGTVFEVIGKGVETVSLGLTINGGTIDGIAVDATSTIINGQFDGISGGVAGIIEAATGKIINAGQVVGGTGDGIDMAATGTLVNTSTGTIKGGLSGVIAAATTMVVNAGTIIGKTGDGIDLAAAATITNLEGGVIEGAIFGVMTAAGAVVINAGTIGGGSGEAILFTGAGSRLVVAPTAVFEGNVVAIAAGNTLELAAGSKTGVITGFATQFQGFGTVVVDAGANWEISGGDAALAITLGVGATLKYNDVVYNGAVAPVSPGTIKLAAGSSFVNAGTVGASTGVVMGASGSVLNTGVINGSHLDGLDGGAGSSVTNSAVGIISGQVAGVVLGANGTVTNSNIISGAMGDGIELGADGTVTNFLTVSGGLSGVTGGAGGVVTNNSSITGAARDGVTLGATGTVVNAGSSSVISGEMTGVIEGATGSVVNIGTITGKTGDGIIVAATGNITNTVTGTITGGNTGVIGAATGTVTNMGSITGQGGDGVDLAATGVVSNYLGAKIYGLHSGIVTNAGGTVNNAGTIIGAQGDGIDLGTMGTIVNAGTIIGGSGTAVSFHDHGLLVVDAGAVFVGKVVANGTGNTLELASGTGSLGSYADNFHGFQNIVVDAGAKWVVTGGEDGPTPTITVADGGTLVYDGTVYGGVSSDTSTTTGMTTIHGLPTYANVINATGNAVMSGAGGTINNFASIQGGLSGIVGGAGMLVTNLGGPVNVTPLNGKSGTVVAPVGDSTVSLSGASNLIQGGAGHTMISGGFLNTYEVTAIGTSGGLDIADFSVNSGDVLQLRDVVSKSSIVSGTISGNDLLVSVGSSAANSYVVADLRGMAGSSISSLMDSHHILTA